MALSCHDPGPYKEWLELMGDEDIDIRREAAEEAMEMAKAFVKMSQKLAARLLELMDDEDSDVRQDAAEGAVKIAESFPEVFQSISENLFEKMTARQLFSAMPSLRI